MPSVSETAVAKLDMASWFGLFAPSATSAAIVQRLRVAFVDIMAQPELIERFQKTGGRALKMTATEAESFVKQESERWMRLVREAGVKAE